MAVEWQEVSSSNVQRVAYDEDAGELLVEFKNGAVYAYSGQSESAYQDIITSPSPGAYVARWLRNQPARKVK